jgi:hypothetical protein
MIHHLSIPATDPRHVADVLVELIGGVLTPFGPYRDSWIAWAGDEHGAAIDVYPVGTELYPDPDGNGQANFRHNPNTRPYTATHATVSVDRTIEEVLAIAAREGWTAIPLSRGPFDVIEFWVENAVLLEVMTPQMVEGYLAATPRATPPT